MNLPKRVLLVTNIPTPYRIPLYNEINHQLDRNKIQFKVLFGALQYRRRMWEVDLSACRFDYEVLSSSSFERGRDAEKTSFIYTGLYGQIKQYRADVVIVGGFSMAALRLWFRSWFAGPPYIIWAGSIASTPQPFGVYALRIRLIKRATGCIAYGSASRDYFRMLGAREEIIHVAINTVDTSFFSAETEKLRQRRSSQNNTPHRLLYIGYLTRGKNLLSVLDSVRVLSKERDDFVLDIVGDGDDRQRLEDHARQHGLDRFVFFHGYKQKADLPFFLARSRCFVFPSTYDIWGLVLIEAMAAGLPILSSVDAGATRDLVQEGRNGFAVDFSNRNYVLDKIRWILDHADEAARMGLDARRFVKEHASLEKSAQGFVNAILMASA